MHRTWAIVERELRRFRRSPMLIVMSMIFPVVQLVVLGYAFGGNVKHLKVGVVDQDHGVPAVKVRELAAAASSGARTIDAIEYTDPGQALTDLRNGRINGVLTIPPEFSRRVLERNQPRIALIEDNTDNFVSVALAGTMNAMLGAYNQPAAQRVPGQATLDEVEVYPYVPYVQYPRPGSGEARGAVRRPKPPVVFSERRRLAAPGIPGGDAGDRRRRSVHIRCPWVKEPAAKEHRVRGDRRRSGVPADLLGRLDDRRHDAVPPDAMSGRDLETRERLLRTAARMFADRGFKRVTVRDICRRARANVAAVDYHLLSKLALHREAP